jgi:hypothetical protein
VFLTSGRKNVARYRLRFHLQEFDLRQGETILGRSPDCQVTIEDPLVSRHHARVIIDGDEAKVEDMGSRNGVRVNGAPIRGATLIKDGDRIRIGTQEVLFSKAPNVYNPTMRNTGCLRHCALCGTPYAEEMVACPSCGSTEPRDDDTLSGLFGESKQSWSLQLLTEVLEKALSMNRQSDALRILRRVTGDVETHISSGRQLDKRQLDTLAELVSRLIEAQASYDWAKWLVAVYAQIKGVPPVLVVQRIASLPHEKLEHLKDNISELVNVIQQSNEFLPTEEGASLKKLEKLHQELQGS